MATRYASFQTVEPGNTGKDLAYLNQTKAANNARIAELETELKQLEESSQKDLTDADILDLELAANRARAYDMGGATTALSRMGSRAVNRETARLNALKAKQLKDEQNQIKIGELQDKFRQLQINKSKAETKADKDLYDSQLMNIGSQIRALGGTVDESYNGINTADVMDNYYTHTVNTAKGLQFTGDDKAREQLVNDLRAIGKYKEADDIQALKTPQEKAVASQKEKNLRIKLKKSASTIYKKINDYKHKKPADFTLTDTLELDKLRTMADSLARNYPNYIKLEGDLPKYTGKD